MSLKLFRSTEFAESSHFLPSVQRMAIHPFWVAALASAWLATACNFVLWRELLRLPGMESIEGLWFGLRLGLSIFALLCALLGLLNWRWSFKPVITLLLFCSAFSTHLMLSHSMVIDASIAAWIFQSRAQAVSVFFSSAFLVIMLVLAVLPSLWLWRTPVQRIPTLPCLAQNILFVVASALLLAAMCYLFEPDLSQQLREQTTLRQFINPLNSLTEIIDLFGR